VGQISSLIIEKVKVITAAEDPTELRAKRKVIATLLPYAIWQERDGESEVLDAFLDAARASGMSGFVWHRVEYFTRTLLHEATPRAIVLVSPRIPWHWLTIGEGSIQLWVAAASAAQYTEEVAQCVVDTLLRIASEDELLPHITVNVWSWLTKQPSLPPVCLGRFYGSYLHVVKAVRGLGDIEVLKSYMLLAWSEWNALWDEGFDEICVSLREDFGGVGMGLHRADFVQRLDHILGQLDQGLASLKRHNPNLRQRRFQKMKDQYGKLKEILLEIDNEGIARASCPMLVIFCTLTQVDMRGALRFLCDVRSFTSGTHSFVHSFPTSSITGIQHLRPPITHLPSLSIMEHAHFPSSSFDGRLLGTKFFASSISHCPRLVVFPLWLMRSSSNDILLYVRILTLMSVFWLNHIYSTARWRSCLSGSNS